MSLLPAKVSLVKFGRHRPSLLVSKRDFLFLIIIIIIIIIIIKFGRHRPSLLVSKRDFLFLLIIIIIIIIFLSPRLQRQFTSNLLQTSAQWSLGIHLPD